MSKLYLTFDKTPLPFGGEQDLARAWKDFNGLSYNGKRWHSKHITPVFTVDVDTFTNSRGELCFRDILEQVTYQSSRSTNSYNRVTKVEFRQSDPFVFKREDREYGKDDYKYKLQRFNIINMASRDKPSSHKAYKAFNARGQVKSSREK